MFADYQRSGMPAEAIIPSKSFTIDGRTKMFCIKTNLKQSLSVIAALQKELKNRQHKQKPFSLMELITPKKTQ